MSITIRNIFLLELEIFDSDWVSCKVQALRKTTIYHGKKTEYFPSRHKRWINVGLTLVQRRRRWTNVKPTLIQRIVSAGNFPINGLILTLNIILVFAGTYQVGYISITSLNVWEMIQWGSLTGSLSCQRRGSDDYWVRDRGPHRGPQGAELQLINSPGWPLYYSDAPDDWEMWSLYLFSDHIYCLCV